MTFYEEFVCRQSLAPVTYFKLKYHIHMHPRVTKDHQRLALTTKVLINVSHVVGIPVLARHAVSKVPPEAGVT